jgi:hypothetical protein
MRGATMNQVDAFETYASIALTMGSETKPPPKPKKRISQIKDKEIQGDLDLWFDDHVPFIQPTLKRLGWDGAREKFAELFDVGILSPVLIKSKKKNPYLVVGVWDGTEYIPYSDLYVTDIQEPVESCGEDSCFE